MSHGLSEKREVFISYKKATHESTTTPTTPTFGVENI